MSAFQPAAQFRSAINTVVPDKQTALGIIGFTVFGLLAMWGIGSYKAPKFFNYITGTSPLLAGFFHWLMLFMLAYQGFADQDLVTTLIISIVVFSLFELVKMIEANLCEESTSDYCLA